MKEVTVSNPDEGFAIQDMVPPEEFEQGTPCVEPEVESVNVPLLVVPDIPVLRHSSDRPTGRELESYESEIAREFAGRIEGKELVSLLAKYNYLNDRLDVEDDHYIWQLMRIGYQKPLAASLVEIYKGKLVKDIGCLVEEIEQIIGDERDE